MGKRGPKPRGLDRLDAIAALPTNVTWELSCFDCGETSFIDIPATYRVREAGRCRRCNGRQDALRLSSSDLAGGRQPHRFRVRFDDEAATVNTELALAR